MRACAAHFLWLIYRVSAAWSPRAAARREEVLRRLLRRVPWWLAGHQALAETALQAVSAENRPEERERLQRAGEVSRAAVAVLSRNSASQG